MITIKSGTSNNHIAMSEGSILEEIDTPAEIHMDVGTQEELNTFIDKPTEDETLLTGRRKRGRKRKQIDSSNERSFRLKWLTHPELQEWLAPVANTPAYVSCKWCKALLRAHLHDLKKHAGSKKHRRHISLYSKRLNTSKDVNSINDIDRSIISHGSTKFEVKIGLPIEFPQENDERTAAADARTSEGLSPSHIGFIGSGNMAQALISGFISNGLVEPNNVIVSAPSERNLQKLKPLGIKTTHENKKVIEESDMVFLAVKPHIIPEVLGRLEPIESSHNPLFVSIATGLSITRLEAMLNHVIPVPRVIRIMPNTPCMVLQGCAVFSLGSNVASEEGKAIKCLLGSVGLCEEVPEQQIDGVCGVAGSGPAYIYAAIEAMADGGVKMGLPRNLALALAAQTVKGAASMVIETGKHPGQLKDEVCSPAGTTICGMHALEKNGFSDYALVGCCPQFQNPNPNHLDRNTLKTVSGNAIISAVEASAKRSKELG